MLGYEYFDDPSQEEQRREGTAFMPAKSAHLQGLDEVNEVLRFALIALPARVLERGRQLFVRVSRDHPALAWLWQMGRKTCPERSRGISALAAAAA